MPASVTPKPTERQLEVLAFIRSYRAEHGMSPTIREISEHFGFGGPNATMGHVKALEAKGLLTRGVDSKSRSLMPVYAAGCCPTCGQPIPERSETRENTTNPATALTTASSQENSMIPAAMPSRARHAAARRSRADASWRNTPICPASRGPASGPGWPSASSMVCSACGSKASAGRTGTASPTLPPA